MNKHIFNVDLTGLNITGYIQNPWVGLSFDMARAIGMAKIIDDHTVEVEFSDTTALIEMVDTMQLLTATTEILGNKILLGLFVEPKLGGDHASADRAVEK